MEVAIKEESKTRLVLDIVNGTPAITNAIKKKLWNHKNVSAAGIHKEHPLLHKETIVLETTGAEPRTVLKESISALKKDLDKTAASVKTL